jgi:hemoglobin
MFPDLTCFLLVDQSEPFRRELATILGRLGFLNVLESNLVSKANQQIEERREAGKPIDVIISGWSMPDTSGLEFLYHVRSNEPGDTPFIILGDYPDAGNTDLALKSGASAYLSKPINERKIFVELQKLWGRKQARGTLADTDGVDGEKPTLFDKYGGLTTVSNVVRMFYKEVLERPHLAYYFRGVPLERLIRHQIHLVAVVLGRPPEFYKGRNIVAAHAGRSIEGVHFDEVADLLNASLIRAGITAEDRVVIMEQVAALKTSVVQA